jgi:hypothetical protein
MISKKTIRVLTAATDDSLIGMPINPGGLLSAEKTDGGRKKR